MILRKHLSLLTRHCDQLHNNLLHVCSQRNLKLIMFHLLMAWLLPNNLMQKRYDDDEMLQTRSSQESSVHVAIADLLEAKNIHG